MTAATAAFEDARTMRERLVNELAEAGDVRTDRVRDAMLRVPRHAFVPPDTPLWEAYGNVPLPIGEGQTISQPAVVAIMTEALQLDGDESVLEIGTGSGYQAAVLSLLTREVFSVELFPRLADGAAKTLRDLGFSNVQVRCGDGSLGWKERAPFDRIIATAAPQTIPPAWFDQLREDGFLVAPLGSPGDQRLIRYCRADGAIREEELARVAFVEILPARH